MSNGKFHPTPEEIDAAVAGIKQLIELAEPEGPHYVEPEQVSQLRTLLSAVEQAQEVLRTIQPLIACNAIWEDSIDQGETTELWDAFLARHEFSDRNMTPEYFSAYWRQRTMNTVSDTCAALSSLPPDPLLVEARDAQTKAPDVVFQALVDAREYFAERADAEYFTDSPRAHGNAEMQLMSAMDEAIAIWNRAATGEKQ